MPEASRLGRPAVVRLIFEYEGDQMRLTDQQRVDVAIPEPGLDVSAAPRPGYYVEARSAAGEALSRVPVGVEFTSIEVFPEVPGGMFMRINVPVPQGAFTVALS